MTKAVAHSIQEDIQAFILGTAFCALGLEFLTYAGLITGQTAGLAVLLSYVTEFSFGTVFFVINIPFYALAWFRMGARFTTKTFICVGLLSVMTELVPMFFTISDMHPAFAAFFGGALAGFGLIVLFRHGASLGGMGVVALYIQDRTGFRAGWTQLCFDAVLFTVAVFVLRLDIVVYSLLGAVVTNMIIGVNHRADRYVGR